MVLLFLAIVFHFGQTIFWFQISNFSSPLLFPPSLSISFSSSLSASHFPFLSITRAPIFINSIGIELALKKILSFEEKSKEIDNNSHPSFPNATYFILIFSAKIHSEKISHSTWGTIFLPLDSLLSLF